MDNDKAFKNLINEAVVKLIICEIKKVDKKFPAHLLEQIIPQLKALELKDRVLLVTNALASSFAKSYPENIKVIKQVIKNNKLTGFQLWPFSEFISQFGLSHFDESMDAMYELTQKFTSEFAVRPFIIQDHLKVLNHFQKITCDPNVHIRRWVSEGTRPLLPWGQKIAVFVNHPELAIELLEKLKYDEEIYVRKSVANHLNDISKNHPLLVIKIVDRWQKECPAEHFSKIAWIKKQALRTLIKKGHPGALKLMGVNGKGKIKIQGFKLDKKTYKLGEKMTFQFTLISQGKSRQSVVIDYGIDFLKANGKLGRKIFKLKNIELDAGSSIEITKTHALKAITTMKFYSGVHQICLQVNGVCLESLSFNFKV
jgi:3-methyladenine DNA glycosylase AlkC